MKPISAEHLAEVKEHFAFFDRDSNGEIDIHEFEELLKILSPESTADHAQRGFSFIDSDHNGSIDFDEFLEWWETCWWEF